MRMRTGFIIAGIAGVAISGSAAADMELLFSGKAIDHPDGGANPPGYGLRLDGLFTFEADEGSFDESAASGGVTTFSFSHAEAHVITEVFDTDDDGNGDTVRVHGVVVGGEDNGSEYGFGKGKYEIDFVWNRFIEEIDGDDGGWKVSPSSIANKGFIKALEGVEGVEAGTSWDLFEQEDKNKNTFKLLRDGHRLGDFPELGSLDPYVGRGWVTLNDDGTKDGLTQDFLFVVVPVPAALPLGLAGLGGVAGLAWIRRRG